MDQKTAITEISPALSPSDRARQLCLKAKEFEEIGNYESAREALSEVWQRIGDRPRIDGLDDVAGAEVLLRTGTLTGWLGSARQVPGAQEIAKDLISEAARIFAANDLSERVAEARVDLGICYWREGAFDEARVTLDEALHQLGDLQSEQRLRAYLNKAIVEKVSNRYDDALRTHRAAAPFFQASDNDALRGKFHNEYAQVLKNVGLARNNSDLIDQSLVEFTAATFHAEQAGNKRFLALVENNIGFLFVRLGRFDEAHAHLDRARTLFTALKDKGMVAQVNDTRARAYIAQGSLTKGEAIARTAVKTLEEGDEHSLLAEALTTHATALARLGNFPKAKVTLEKAIRTAHDAGDRESGGVAALTMVEELRPHLKLQDQVIYYTIAETELAKSQHPEVQDRLGRCARSLLTNPSFPRKDIEQGFSQLKSVAPSAEPVLATDQSLEDQVRHYEGTLIRQALEVSDGSVTRAARMLGITHQGLAFILNGRHKDLLAARKPVKRRRRSIIRFH